MCERCFDIMSKNEEFGYEPERALAKSLDEETSGTLYITVSNRQYKKNHTARSRDENDHSGATCVRNLAYNTPEWRARSYRNIPGEFLKRALKLAYASEAPQRRCIRSPDDGFLLFRLNDPSHMTWSL